MFGPSSLDVGTQLYSESSKKSSNLEFITDVIRETTPVSVLSNADEALSRIVPPRCAVLRTKLRVRRVVRTKILP